jgi:DNA-binding SARP family transcriptional activator
MLHISLLGEQVITDGTAADVVRTRSSRTLALVAFLVVHAGSPQARGHIAGLFWPDSTDAQALTNLRRELHHLRHTLGDESSLVVTPAELCWRDSETCRVDVRTFATEYRSALAAAAHGDSERALGHATTATSLYRGALLPGGYEDWLLEARSELEGQCVALCDLISETRARQGDLTGAVAIGRRRIRLRPLEEVGYRILMELQADLGDRAGAVSTYHHCASVLERELGVEPDKATRKTLERLMAQASQDGPLPAHEPAVGRSGFAEAELIGRSPEVGLLLGLWRTAAAGRPSLALVRGDAGVGKTRLVAEIARVARMHGAVVASTQCFESSGRLALAPVADWLRNPAVQSATATLDPIWRAEVDRLVPSGRGREASGAGSRAMVDAWQRHRFFEGLARALIGGRRPMLLVLDNLQWCDQETLTFLAFCLRLTTDAPLMVAGTLRADFLDYHPELVDWTAGMRATGMLTELSLSPLEVTETARLAEAIAGHPLPEHDTQLLQATTGGFPLYVVEAVRGTVDAVRESGTVAGTELPVGDLKAVLRNRFQQATPAAQEVARLAAAVGRNFTLDLLTEASDLDAAVVVRAVDELWRRRIMREFRDGYDFAHDLLRETAYAQISPPERWLLHRRLAQGLELIHAEDTDPVSAQLAEQYALSGQALRAVVYYRRAADIAAARFAHVEAIRLHRVALSIVRAQPEGRARDRHELSVLEAMAAPLNARYGYSSPQLREALERSTALAEALGRNDSTLSGLLGLWASSFVQGHTSAAHQTAARALALVEPDSELTGPAHFAFGGSAVSLTKGAHSLSIGTRPDVHGKAWAAHAHWLLGHDDEALRCCHDAVDLARAVDHPYSLAVALAYAGITHQLRLQMAELRDAVGELGELCDRYGFAYYREWALILGGWGRADTTGIGLVRRGIDNLKAEGAFARMPYWLSLFADLSARNDRPDAAATALDAALVGGQARNDLWWIPEVMRQRAAYDGRDAAIKRLHSAVTMAGAHGSVALQRRCERDLAV